MLTIITMFVGSVAFAQVTTSALGGKVVDAQGEAVVGAYVVATHTPSGTIYGATTNLDGRYTIQGMRSGGPYTVVISCLGYQDVTYTELILQLAETATVNATLTDDTQLLEQAVVIGQAASKLYQEKTGASTNITGSQITALPTVSRSITDVTRLSPYGGNGMSFAGSDGRTANFTVDGANFNNNFGLNDNLPGGGNPISIDAIDELQVVISPYDVRQTNFIGGGVNAITKSGTNTFRGTAYIYHQNENLRGDTVDGSIITSARDKDRKTIYGMTFGGPIIKNKLFFFVNAEMSKIPTVVNRYRANPEGQRDKDNYLSRTTPDDLKAVSDYVYEKYGYNTGSWTDFPADEDNTKLLARLDWNINRDHHLALRYNYTLNNYWQNPNATSMDGGTRMANARVSDYSMSFANSMYSMQNLVNTWSLDLNSRLSDNLSNQFLATYSELNDIRGSNSSEFPFIDITRDTGEGVDNYMALGYELFTWNNAVHNTVANVKDDLTYYFGTHKITAGASFEYQMADNQYMRNGTGYYRYNITDNMYGADGILNAAALFASTPEVVCLTYGYDGEKKPAARVRFNKAGIYAQDEWSVMENLKLTYGLRIDGLFFNNSDLMTNGVLAYNEDGTIDAANSSGILSLSYYPKKYDFKEKHIDTGTWPKSTVTVSPRIGFSWDVFGNRSLKVRGGTGLFSGRLPLVFFTNMPTNGGLVQYQAQLSASKKIPDGYTGAYIEDSKGNKYIDMNQFAGGLVTGADGKTASIEALYNKLVSLGYPETVTPEDGSVPSTISAVDPNFRMPQVWKTSLAFDYSLPTSFPLSITAEGIFNKTINAVSISDWSMKDVGGFARFNGVDNRPIYPADFRQGKPAFVLENTDKGYGWSANVTLNASTANRALEFMAAYTHTVSKEITGMPGSAAESAFTYVPTSEGPNYIKLHNSQYVTPNRIVASLTHNDKSGNHFSLIYETWMGGYKYSYMLSNDMNGDGYNYDTVYIPTDAQVESGEFRFVSDDDRDRFMDYVHASDYLSAHQGEYAEPYSLYNPWVHRFDISYKHDFKIKVGNTTNKFQVGFDIKNVLNMFNSSWGVSKSLNPELGSDPRILKYEGVDGDGYATFSTPEAVRGSLKTFTPNHTLGQCWYASIGIKYLFN